MKEIALLGIDLAKNVFQIIGLDKHHKEVVRKRLSRTKLQDYIGNLPTCRILGRVLQGKIIKIF